MREKTEDEEMFLLPEELIYNEQEAKKSDGGESEGEDGKTSEVRISQQGKDKEIGVEQKNRKNKAGQKWELTKASTGDL